MKSLSATAHGEAAAPIDACYDRLVDVERYSSWYPAGVRRAETIEQDPDGSPAKVRTTFVLQRLKRDFTIDMAARLERPRLVELRRLPKQPGDPEQVLLRWRLNELGGERTAVAIDLEATLDLPRFLPIGGVGDSIARGFLDAAVASFV